MKARSLLVSGLAAGSLAAALAVGSGSAGAAAGNPAQPVASDGSAVVAGESAGSATANSGTGGPTTELKVDLTGVRAMTADGPGPAGESIIGADNRVRVNPTTTYPARATALITFSGPGGTYSCSGWFINRNTVATAGHCVSPGTNSGFYSVSSYRVYPGYNGTFAPYGVCTARTIFSVQGWVQTQKDDYDYGAIKLSASCDTKGNTTGWYGFTTTMSVGLGTTIAGYPGDKPFTQWKSVDSLRALDTRRVFYKNDTVGGMSGSPVYINRASCGGPCGVAVHAYGTGGTGIYATHNHGTRITSSVFNNFQAWKAA